MNNLKKSTDELAKKNKDAAKEVGGFSGAATGALISLSFLQGAIGDTSTKFGRIIQDLTGFGVTLSTISLLTDPIKGAGDKLILFGGGLSAGKGKLSGLGGSFAKVGKFLKGPYLAGLAVAAAAFVAIKNVVETLKDGFTVLDEEIKSIDLASFGEDIQGRLALTKRLNEAISKELKSREKSAELQEKTGKSTKDIAKLQRADLVQSVGLNEQFNFGFGRFSSARRQGRSRNPRRQSDTSGLAAAFNDLNKDNIDTIASFKAGFEDALDPEGLSDSFKEGIGSFKDILKEAAAASKKEGGGDFTLELSSILKERLARIEKELENQATNEAIEIARAAQAVFVSFRERISELRIDRITAGGTATRQRATDLNTARITAAGLSEGGAGATTRQAQLTADLNEQTQKRLDLESKTQQTILDQTKSVTKNKELTEDQSKEVEKLLTTFNNTEDKNKDIEATALDLVNALGASGVEASQLEGKFVDTLFALKEGNAEISETEATLKNTSTEAEKLSIALAKIKLPGLRAELDVLKTQLGEFVTVEIDGKQVNKQISESEAIRLQGEQALQEKITKLRDSVNSGTLKDEALSAEKTALDIAESELKIFKSTEDAKDRVRSTTLAQITAKSAESLTDQNRLLQIQSQLQLGILNTEEKLTLEFEKKDIQSQKEISDLDRQIQLKKDSISLDAEGNDLNTDNNKTLRAEIKALESAKTEVTNRIAEEKKLNAELKRRTGLAGGAILNSQSLKNLEEDIVKNIPENFSSNLSNAFKEASKGAKSLGEALQDGAKAFGQTILDQFLEIQARRLGQTIFGTGEEGDRGFLGDILGLSKGGLVTGGSGVRDDVPAKLTDGEFVLRKSAVDKYGLEFLQRLNDGFVGGYQDGGLFVPGERGQGAITGTEDLLRFANQAITSGSTDVISSSPGGASINLETQSRRLTDFGRRRQSPARQQLDDARREAFETVLAQRAEDQRAQEEYDRMRKARRKAFQNTFISTFASQAISGAMSGELFGESFNVFGTDIGSEAGGIGGVFRRNIGDKINLGEKISNVSDRVKSIFSKGVSASSGPILDADLAKQGFTQTDLTPPVKEANGGSMFGDTNALLTAGEFVMSAPASQALGQDLLTDINNLRYANGGPVGGSSSVSTTNNNSTVGDVNINVSVDKNGNPSVETSTNEEQTPEQARKFANKVRSVVLQVIQEEQRVAGSLFGT